MDSSDEAEVYVEGWERLLAAALLEPDYSKLRQRIAGAETAIISCVKRLDASCHSSKATALMDALITLRDLRTLGHT